MTPVLELLDIQYPIVQAPVGGIATPELAAAVSNSGGLGGLALSWCSLQEAECKIRNFQSLSSRPMYANFVLNFEPLNLQRALELGVTIIQFSWGMPSKDIVDLIRSYDAVMGIQVGNREGAKKAIALGADYLVCQGNQAGGHVQGSRTLESALNEIMELSDGIPVLASGGISSGMAVKQVMDLGASGVVMGTRFVASIESGAHAVYKEALITSNSNDTVLTVCMNKGWDNAHHRIIRNSTFNQWEADGCNAIGNRPGEFDTIAKHSDGTAVERYSFSAPILGDQGHIEAMTMYAGHSVNHIHQLKSARDIVSDIWNDYLNLTAIQ